MLDLKHQFLFDEIKENDRKVNIQETISGLNMAGSLLTNIAKGSDEGERSMAIDGLEAVISAMAYISLMHSTVENIESSEGGDACV